LEKKAATSKEKSQVEFSEIDGAMLVSFARETVSHYLKTKKIIVPEQIKNDSRFNSLMGCFVTLKENDSEKNLRGCIGFAEPVYKLSYALTNAAVAAAVDDPRFPPIRSEKELDNLLVEVSILTPPVLISVRSQKEILGKVIVGKDGLIMRWTLGSGLLLPQVATEYSWDAEEFLCNLSMKAGAAPDQWLVPGTEILKFQAIVFSETSPKGSVVMGTD